MRGWRGAVLPDAALALIMIVVGGKAGRQSSQLLGQLTYDGQPAYGFGSSSAGSPTDTWGRNLYIDTLGSAYGSGWSRENSFLAQKPGGGFCYSFGPRPPYPGYPASPPRQGNGSKYRITVLGPGVTPAVMWEGNDVGTWNPNDPADVAPDATAATMKQTLGLTTSECHS